MGVSNPGWQHWLVGSSSNGEFFCGHLNVLKMFGFTVFDVGYYTICTCSVWITCLAYVHDVGI